MDQEIKRQWVAALRSGDYKQGNGALRERHGDGVSDTYCCLGVLCDIAVKADVISQPDLGEAEEPGYTEHFYLHGYLGAQSYLPDEVVAWAGLPSENPDIEGDAATLSELNDEGASFDDIADLIEEQL